MKIFVITALILLTALPLSADQGEAKPVNRHTQCSAYAELAETIMEVRQKGVPMSAVMDIFRDEEKGVRSMVVEAYETPRWPIKEYQQMAIDDFRDENYLACFKRFNK